MADIAYRKRGYIRIKIRKIKYFLFKALKKVIKKLIKGHYHQVHSILIYPTVTGTEKCSDLLNRTAWAFPKKDNLKIYFPVLSTQERPCIKSIIPPADQYNYLKEDLSHIVFVEQADLELLQPDAILVHDNRIKTLKNILSQFHKVDIIDKHYYSAVEPMVWRNFYFQAFSEKEKRDFENLSKRNFLNLSGQCQGKRKAYCFTTGPSFSKYKEFKYENNSLKIICNTIVKNDKFLDYITKPDLLVYADPAFHFGPSEYASVFRDCALRVIERYNCFVMVPHETVPLMLSHYPVLRDKIIGMRHDRYFNFPSIDKFWVKGSNNILIKFMLPVASAFVEKIYIIGADGREKKENYFWKHSPLVQYDDLMDSVFNTHPSFFRDRIYSDYYKQHCRNLEKILEYGEKLGKKYYSLTPSHIPALRKRYKEPG